MARLRIGLIGAGWVSQHHLQAWAAASQHAAVVAIADPLPDRAAERAARFGIGRIHASAEQMLDAEALDAVDIAAPRELHVPLARLALARGVHVLCQKPLAPTLAQAQTLVLEVQQSAPQARLMVHENWRFRPCYRRIGQWLRDGRIGAVRQGCLSLLSSGLLPGADGRRPLLVRQPFIAGLDRALVSEMLIHHIDTLRFLLGDMQLASARLGQAVAGNAGEDRASLVFDTAGGGVVSVLANLCVHGEPPGLVDRLSLFGDAGSIHLDGGALRCAGRAPGVEDFDLVAGYQASYDAAIAHFVASLASGAEFETSPQDNLQTLQLVEAIYEAAPPR